MTDPIRRARLIAEGRCVECSQPRGDSPVATRCTGCAAKHRAAQAALRRKKRFEDPWHDITGGDPFPMGGAAPRLESAALLRIRLDNAALRGIETLKKAERQRCLAAGERYLGFQVSRLIREHIRTYATRDFPAPPRTLNTETAVTFHCDAPTLAIIDYHARRRFDGNRAATVRAMLAALTAPPTLPDHDEDDFQSPFDDPRFYEKKRQQANREAAQAEAIQREAAANRYQPRKNFWEYSPVYKDNKAIGERKREEEA
jgi:hypothetical protein